MLPSVGHKSPQCTRATRRSFRRSDASERWARRLTEPQYFASGGFRLSDASERWALTETLAKSLASLVFASPMLPSVGHVPGDTDRDYFSSFSPLRCFRALGTRGRNGMWSSFCGFRLSDASERWARYHYQADFGSHPLFSPLRCFRALGTPQVRASQGRSCTFSPLRCFRALGTPRLAQEPFDTRRFRRSDASERWAPCHGQQIASRVEGFRRSDASERWALNR